MPQSSLRSISNDYARLNGSDYGHRTGSPSGRRKGAACSRERVLARIKLWLLLPPPPPLLLLLNVSELQPGATRRIDVVEPRARETFSSSSWLFGLVPRDTREKRSRSAATRLDSRQAHASRDRWHSTGRAFRVRTKLIARNHGPIMDDRAARSRTRTYSEMLAEVLG